MHCCIRYEPITYSRSGNRVRSNKENAMITLNEFAMFITGVFWGIFIIEPICRIAYKIYKNVKENTK